MDVHHFYKDIHENTIECPLALRYDNNIASVELHQCPHGRPSWTSTKYIKIYYHFWVDVYHLFYTNASYPILNPITTTMDVHHYYMNFNDYIHRRLSLSSPTSIMASMDVNHFYEDVHEYTITCPGMQIISKDKHPNLPGRPS